jgi:hypothetical protein
VADDGIFFMAWNDYLNEYKRTSICCQLDLVNYRHSFAYHKFNDINEPKAMFRITLDEDIDCHEETFAVSIAQ